MSLFRGLNQLASRKNLFSRSWIHSAGSINSAALPSNMEEIEAQDKVGFSASRHKDMSYGVVQCQTSSMFSGSFMSDQSNMSGVSGSDQFKQLDHYESLASMNLHSVTQTTVPEPFSPSIDRDSAPRVNLPESSLGQQNKFTASDLQETLYPHGSPMVHTPVRATKGNSWHVLSAACAVPRTHSLARCSSTTTNKPPTALSTKEKLKRAVKDYGATVIVFHVAISITSLSICYAAVASGLDVPGLLANVGVSSEMLESRLTAGASTFLVAYAVHKLFVPVRMSITLGSVPFIVRYLRRIGFLKSPPSS